jgi:hypothetical protein
LLESFAPEGIPDREYAPADPLVGWLEEKRSGDGERGGIGAGGWRQKTAKKLTISQSPFSLSQNSPQQRNLWVSQTCPLINLAKFLHTTGSSMRVKVADLQ